MGLFRKKKPTLKNLSWKDITIGQHQRIIEVFDKYKEEEDKTFLPYDLVGAIYGFDEERMNEMTVSEANEYLATIAFLNKRPKAAMVKGHYWLGEHKYKVTLNPQDLLTSQYLDFQQLADKSGDMPAEFLSVLLVPVGKTYGEGYDVDTVVEDIRNYMSVEDALGLNAFFFNLLRLSIERSTVMLKKMIRKAEKEGKMTDEQLEALRKCQALLTKCESGLVRLTQ